MSCQSGHGPETIHCGLQSWRGLVTLKQLMTSVSAANMPDVQTIIDGHSFDDVKKILPVLRKEVVASSGSPEAVTALRIAIINALSRWKELKDAYEAVAKSDKTPLAKKTQLHRHVFTSFIPIRAAVDTLRNFNIEHELPPLPKSPAIALGRPAAHPTTPSLRVTPASTEDDAVRGSTAEQSPGRNLFETAFPFPSALPEHLQLPSRYSPRRRSDSQSSNVSSLSEESRQRREAAADTIAEDARREEREKNKALRRADEEMRRKEEEEEEEERKQLERKKKEREERIRKEQQEEAEEEQRRIANSRKRRVDADSRRQSLEQERDKIREKTRSVEEEMNREKLMLERE